MAHKSILFSKMYEQINPVLLHTEVGFIEQNLSLPRYGIVMGTEILHGGNLGSDAAVGHEGHAANKT